MKTPAEWKTLFESSAFARQTNYSGPLGPEYNPSGTRLRLWAPTAQSVSVNLYRRGDGGACMGSLPLEPQGQGLWSVYLPGDQHGRYYTFTVEVEGTQYETGDPYARTAGINGLRSMILDAPRIDPPDWSHDHRPAIPASRRTVWEVSVRDFSQDPASGVRTGWRGKFMAFTQKGTTLSSAGTFPTCLDYLKRLGVGYVQLMPIFDFGSVDESRPLTRQYNWGYDPTNYNVPEGSYSTDPSKGEVRVRECKEMIAALHAAGIGVVMDVVYNHMYRNENPLNSTVPYYFFRQNPDGSFSNGSGCGNEFASERPMARKYLIDSVLYWAQEYHIDGFRFDLMGLYDVDTMNELRAALDALPGGRDILMYGEPWQGGGSQLHRYEANKANLAMLSDRIGIFCDNTRDVIKGGCFDAREPGYVEGRPGSFWDIGGAVAAWCRSDKLPTHSPSQIVSYVSAHDNFTLWDKLMLVRYARPEYTAADSAALAQNRLAAGIYLTCMGMPFMQAGEEFARTKKRSGQHLPLFALPQPSGLEAGRAVPRTGGLLPGASGPAGAVPPPERPGRGQPGGYPIFLAGTAPRGLDFARRTRRRRSMAGALRLLQSHGRRKAGPPARRPVEIAERRRIVCALERPQPGLRRRSDTAAMQCHDFRPGITISGPPLYATSRPIMS